MSQGSAAVSDRYIDEDYLIEDYLINEVDDLSDDAMRPLVR